MKMQRERRRKRPRAKRVRTVAQQRRIMRRMMGDLRAIADSCEEHGEENDTGTL